MKKYLIPFAVFLALCTIFHFTFKITSPPFIETKLEELMSNEQLMDSIGGNPRFEFTYNKHDYNLKDTVRYTIKIKGRERLLTYSGVQLRKESGHWLLMNETLAIE